MKYQMPGSNYPYRIVLLFTIAGFCYICMAEKLAIWLAGSDSTQLAVYQTWTGLAFILLTAVLLLLLMRHSMHISTRYYQAMLDAQIKSEALIKSSEEKYMTLFNCSPLAKWIVDSESEAFILENDVACSLLGYRRDEYAGMSFRDICHTDDVDISERLFNEPCTVDCCTSSWVVRIVGKGGRQFLMRLDNVCINVDGRNARLIQAVDITEEMVTQQQLMRANERLRAASEISGLGYWIREPDAGTIYWSPELYRIFDVDPDSFVPEEQQIFAMFHPDDRVALLRDFQQYFSGSKIKDAERRIITRNGRHKWIYERIQIVKDTDGNVQSVEGIVLDITRRKQTEQRLNESNQRLRMVMKATVEAILDWEIPAKKVYLGNGFRQYFGYENYELDYRIWIDNIYKPDRKRVLAELKKVLADKNAEHFATSYRFLKADGSVAWVQHQGVCQRDGNGSPLRVVSAMIDTTASKEYMRKIELQNAALRDITFIQSHVVRAPLATLMGLVSLLKEEAGISAECKDLIAGIGETAQKLDDVIHTIVRKAEAIDE